MALRAYKPPSGKSTKPGGKASLSNVVEIDVGLARRSRKLGPQNANELVLIHRTPEVRKGWARIKFSFPRELSPP